MDYLFSDVDITPALTLDTSWVQGDVGDWLLNVGKQTKVAHVFKNPWSPLWVVEIRACGFTDTYVTLQEAKAAAEKTLRKWIEDLVHVTPPSIDHDDIIYPDSAAHDLFGFTGC